MNKRLLACLLLAGALSPAIGATRLSETKPEDPVRSRVIAACMVIGVALRAFTVRRKQL